MIYNRFSIKSTFLKLKEIFNKYQEEEDVIQQKNLARKFIHIHNHTDFSLLSATTKIDELIKRTLKRKMSSVGIIDYGNMMGAFIFLSTIETYNQNILNTFYKKLKGILGCEFLLSADFSHFTFSIIKKQNQYYKQVLIAKNQNGYNNLIKISSEGYINGFYAGCPIVNKNLILRHKQDLIVLTGDLSGEIPYTIINNGVERAEKIFKWWHEEFEDDFYVELLRHGVESQNYVNKILLHFSHKYGVKYIIQNNTFYLDKKDASAHDILLCVRDNEKQKTPIGKEIGCRFGLKHKEYYFKTQEQMILSFIDVPEAFDYLDELIKKISSYSLKRKVLVPKFSIPKGFINSLASENDEENSYLHYLAFQGAYKRYGNISTSIKERLGFELDTIKKIGFPGYFLIVQDFVSEAKGRGIYVGPGRGSVAGCLVAYCIGITQIDPIQYNLLFERFLNPNRVSLPDIDLDLDDRGRESIIKWVVNKYGDKQVAKIITLGRMAAKCSIRDTARVLNLSLENADNLSKMMPESVSLKYLLETKIPQLKKKLYGYDLENAIKLLQIAKEKILEGQVLQQASILEGSLRNIGLHACGIIITPSDITNYVPIAISKDSDLLLTQFDNNMVESAGLLKIDFLGLKTLSIIKDTIELIEKRHERKLNQYEFPLDDLKTYQLFQKGETIAIFQYESIGMQRYLRKLKPDRFEDLIAMNALYRPGPIQYIPNFIARKHGKESIIYALPEMEEFIKITYGITVYQEQVMLLAQKLAGFGKSQADMLRKAMGKKQKQILYKMKSKFIYGAILNGYSRNVLEKIWKDWESFASYAFNKSHSTCYAYLAFQTAYLKSHYSPEYMAAVLSNNIDNTKDISFFIAECKRIGFNVIGPDINESNHFFLVNKQGNIRFGLKAIKGIGDSFVDFIIKDRSINGSYLSIFDFIKRSDLHINNKKSIESLVLSGAFDSFEEFHRAQYFLKGERGLNFIEQIIHFVFNKKTKNFNDIKIFSCEPWPSIVKLYREKQVIGLYISSHPLDDFKLEINAIDGISIAEFHQYERLSIKNNVILIYGLIIRSESKYSITTRNKFGYFTLEDYQNIREFWILGEAYIKFFHLITANNFLALKIHLDYYNDGIIRIHFLQIKHLNGVFTRLHKKLNIEINLYMLNNNLLEDIENIFFKYKGNETLKILLMDYKENLCIPSRKYSIRLVREVFLILEKLQGINIRLI